MWTLAINNTTFSTQDQPIESESSAATLARSPSSTNREMVLLLAVVWSVLGDPGVDTSTWGAPWPATSFACLRQAGHQFVVVEAFRRSSGVLADGLQTARNARTAGFKDVQLYHFPDNLTDPITQVTDTIEAFGIAGNSSTFLWLDVEGPQYWGRPCANNSAFLRSMVHAAHAQMGDRRVGIYSSKSQWEPITCGDTSFSDLPLWRPHYDGRQDNSDWNESSIGPFGGWSADDVVMKQYNGTTQTCAMKVDLNWRFHLPPARRLGA